MCIWNRTIRKRKYVEQTKSIDNEKHRSNEFEHVPIDDEEGSEVSFDDQQIGLLERLGVKIDDQLHKIFTSYVEK